MSTALIQRATIDEIEGYRRQAIQLFDTAMQTMDEAFSAAAKAAGGKAFYVDRKMSEEAFNSYDTGHQKWLGYLRRKTDETIWHHLIQGYGFERLMDRQAMEEFRAQLNDNPPEVTADVAEATLRNLLGNADMIFRRGVANAFSKLDRRFRSHDGFKIGDRVVLTGTFTEYGSWNHYQRHDDTIRDIERAFYELDGKQMPEKYAGIIGVIDEERQKHRGMERAAFTVEEHLFKFRAFKNGNAHLWFKRDDLLVKVNKVLAEHYGEALGAGHAAAANDDELGPATYKTTLAKNMGWFPTPAAVVERLIGHAQLSCARGYEPGWRILEPSAGEGSIALGAKAVAPSDTEIVCVELHPDRAATLRSHGFKTHEDDFLALSSDMLGKFDRILMNPPFDARRDVDHVAHAVRYLKPGGKLLAIMSARVEWAEDKKAQAFRKLIERMSGRIYDLPAGSFEESGTMVNTCIVELNAPR